MTDKQTAKKTLDPHADFRAEIDAITQWEKVEYQEMVGRLDDASGILERALLGLGQLATFEVQDAKNLRADIENTRPKIDPPESLHEVELCREVRTTLRAMTRDKRAAFALELARQGDKALLQAVAGIPDWLIPEIDPDAIIAAYDKAEFAPKRRELEARLEAAEARLAIVAEAQAAVKDRLESIGRESRRNTECVSGSVPASASA